MADVVETAVYKLGYKAEGQEQVDALRGSVEKLTASTEKQEVSQQKITRATRTTTGEYNRMMGRLNPRIRAEQQLQAALAQTDRLLEENVITSSQAAEAITAATTRYEQSLRRIDASQGALRDGVIGAADATKLSAFQMQNLSFQIQDVGQAIATGQPLFRTLIQQGSQMVQIFGPGVGLAGAMKAVGASITSYLLNPLNIAVLAIAGFAAGVQALIGWLSGAKDETSAMEGITDRLADTVERLRDAYGEAETAQRGLTEAERLDRLFRATVDLTTATEELNREREKIDGQFLQNERMNFPLLSNLVDNDAAVEGLYQLNWALEQGHLKATDYQTAIQALAVSVADPEFTEYVDNLLAQTDAYAEAEETSSGLAEMIEFLGGAIDTTSDSAGNITRRTREAADAFEDATAAATEFVAGAFGPNLDGVDAEIAAIVDRTAELRDGLTAALADPTLDDASRNMIAALLSGLTDAEAQMIETARATHEEAVALRTAEAQANAFNSAMAQLQAIAVPALSASAQAAHALAAAIANASDQTQRLAAFMAYLRGQEALGIGAVNDAIANMQSQIIPVGMSERAQFIRDQYNALSMSAVNAAEASEEAYTEFVATAGALYDNIKAVNEYRASLSGGGGGGGGGGGSLVDAFDKAVEAAEGQIASLHEQAETFGMTADEVARFRIEQALLEAALADGTATDEEMARIEELTARYAAAADELAALKAEQDAAEARQDRIAEAFGGVIDGIMGMVRGTETALDLLIKAVDNVAKRLADYAKKSFAAGNIGGAILGFVGGIVMSLIGRVLEARREMQEAKKNWAEMQDDVAAFAAELNGTGGGELTSALRSARKQIDDFVDAAQKAGAPIDELQKMLTDFAVRAIGQFQRNFGLMIHALESGLGPDSPAVEAAASVAAIGKELAAFVADTKLAVEATGSNAAALQAATAAAQDYALSLLGQPPVLSDVQTEYLRIMGTAQALAGVLADLGMSAEAAAAAIDAGVTAALDALRDQFEKDITAKLNEAIGKGYINEVAALIEEAQSLLGDAELLGVGQAEVLAFFAAEAQNIVNGAGLTGEALDALIELFPELAGVVTDAASVLEEQMSRINDVAGSILDYVNGLLTGPQSSLSPQARLAAAQAQYDAQIALAQAGNIDAQAGITQYADAFLQAAEAMFASSPAFQSIFDQITSDLVGLPAVEQADDPVVVALRETTEQLLGIQQQQIAATKAVGANTTAVNLTTNRLGRTTEQINANLATEYWAPMVQSLAAIEEYTRISANTEEVKHPILHRLFPRLFSARGGLIPGFAGGGMVGNGVWNQDSVLAQYAGGGSIALAGGEYVVSAPSVNDNTMPFLSAINQTGAVPGNDNRQDFVDLMRVFADGTNAQVMTLRAGFDRMVVRLDRIERRQRIEAGREPRAAGARRRQR